MTTLIIGRFNSHCGNCGEEAFMHETGHDTVAGYGEQGPGCGERWTAVTSYYLDVKRMLDEGTIRWRESERHLVDLPVV